MVSNTERKFMWQLNSALSSHSSEIFWKKDTSISQYQEFWTKSCKDLSTCTCACTCVTWGSYRCQCWVEITLVTDALKSLQCRLLLFLSVNHLSISVCPKTQEIHRNNTKAFSPKWSAIWGAHVQTFESGRQFWVSRDDLKQSWTNRKSSLSFNPHRIRIRNIIRF